MALRPVQSSQKFCWFPVYFIHFTPCAQSHSLRTIVLFVSLSLDFERTAVIRLLWTLTLRFLQTLVCNREHILDFILILSEVNKKSYSPFFDLDFTLRPSLTSSTPSLTFTPAQTLPYSENLLLTIEAGEEKQFYVPIH